MVIILIVYDVAPKHKDIQKQVVCMSKGLYDFKNL
jgi:hypothetical protein